MDILNGLKNFLQFINDNWTTIIVIICLSFGIYNKIKLFVSKSKEEKVDIIKTQIKATILKLVTDAEITYNDWHRTGEIKRSEVINKIFEKYPILQTVTNQNEIIEWIDGLINESLDSLNKIIK